MKPVFVTSNGHSVELFLNGRSLGKGNREGFLFTFKDVAYAPGTLKAVATFADGQKAEQVLTTAGPPAAIRLTPHTGPRGFVADGSDLMLVDVEVVDVRGQRVPTAFDLIDFRLDGPAEWRGGMAQGDSTGKPRAMVATMGKTEPGVTPTKGTARAQDNYILSKHLPVELGINRVLVRSSTRAGQVRLTATAVGLKLASLALTSVPAPVKGGLSTVFPEDAQRSHLSRGPTPSTPTVVQRARTVPVQGISAGSNGLSAAASHDDNEATSWSSDGRPETAWIEYQSRSTAASSKR